MNSISSQVIAFPSAEARNVSRSLRPNSLDCFFSELLETPSPRTPLSELENMGYTVKNRMLNNPEGKEIGNFIAWPVRRVCEINHTVESYLVLGGIRLDTGETLPEVTLSPEKAFKMEWIQREWGYFTYMNPNAKPLVQQMIRQLADFTSIQSLSNRIGWHQIGGKPVFIHVRGAVGMPELNVQVDVPVKESRLSRFYLPDHDCDLSASSEAFLRFLDCGSPNVLLPAAAVVLAAPLGTLMKQAGCSLDFVPFLVGWWQSGKSTLAALCQACFGDFDKKSFPANFRDSARSLEPKFAFAKDVLVVIDDFHPRLGNELATMCSLADSVGRMIADGNSPSRLTMEHFEPESFCLCTGETRPDMAESGQSRFLFIDVFAKDLKYKDAVLPLSEQTHLLRQFTVLYLEWIARNWDRLKPLLRSRYNQWLAELEGPDGRSREAVAKLGASLETGLEFLLEIGSISLGEHRLRFRQSRVSMQMILSRQVGPKPTDLFFATLAQLRDLGKIRLTPDEEKTALSANWVGTYSDNAIYLHPARCIDQVNRWLKKNNKFVVVPDPRRLNKLLAEDGYIRYDKEREHYTICKRIKGTTETFEMLAVNHNAVSDFHFFANDKKMA